MPRRAGHVIGYHIGAGDSGEWLGPYFWEAYIDCSPVNRQRFSAFLAERYGTDGGAAGSLGRSGGFAGGRPDPAAAAGHGMPRNVPCLRRV